MTPKDKIRVLIVDDIAETRENIRKLLQSEPDIDVVAMARTGREGIRLAREYKPNVVLMDINMPDLDGIQATEVVVKEVPIAQVIIVSVNSDVDYLRRAMLAGARDFLAKPPSADELINAIRRFGDRSRQQKKEAEIKQLRLQAQEINLRIIDTEEKSRLFSTETVKGRLVDEVERLAAGIAHDLRSPLNLILGIIDSTRFPDKDTATKVQLRRIRRRCQYCRWIADTFLGISLTEKTNPDTIKVLDVVANTLELLEGKLSSSLNIHIDILPEDSGYGDANLLQLALMHVVTNAIESMPDGGTLHIFRRETSSGIEIVVSDSGVGVSDYERALFRFGFTTKPAHSGIGLYVARRIMRQQHGDVTYEHSTGRGGSSFVISMPKKISHLVKSQDIARMEQQLRELNDQVEQLRKQPITDAQKSAVAADLRNLTSTVAQNLYNELALIEATINELLPKLEDKEVGTTLNKITKNASYCRLLVRNLLELGETTSPRWKLLSVIDVIEDVLSLLERKMPPDLYQVEWDIDPTLENVEADEIQLKQVFMNLTRNALDAMPNGGVIKYRLAQDGSTVMITVSDSGTGISSENFPQLFTLGFTTKEKGYGIGLYSVKTIISRHSGTVDVSSQPGKGTAFTIRLPITHGQKEAVNE